MIWYSTWYNKLIRNPLRYYIPMIQQDIRYYIPIDTANYYVTTLLLIQHATKLIYSYSYSKLICYHTTIDTTISRYYTLLIQQSMHPIPAYYNNNATSYDVHPPAAGEPPPMRIPGAARRTLHQLTKTMNYVLLYCFFCFCHLCYWYLPEDP